MCCKSPETLRLEWTGAYTGWRPRSSPKESAMRIARCSVVLTIALVIGLFVSAELAQADDSAWKAAHDTDPHLALTAEQLAMTAAKRAAETTSAAPFLA